VVHGIQLGEKIPKGLLEYLWEWVATLLE
jgi:hypothetical protein